MNAKRRLQEGVAFIFLLLLAVLYLAPIGIVLMNSFKGRFFISDSPFAMPDGKTFVGIDNYFSGIAKTGFLQFPFNCSLANTLYSLFSTEHIFIHGNNLKGSNFGVRNTTL